MKSQIAISIFGVIPITDLNIFVKITCNMYNKVGLINKRINISHCSQFTILLFRMQGDFFHVPQHFSVTLCEIQQIWLTQLLSKGQFKCFEEVYLQPYA
jgi:hypothetical protein